MKLPADYTALTWQERKQAREQYVLEQEGLCAHCASPLAGLPADKIRSLPVKKRLFPIHFFDHPVHLHHCHKTGMTIGAVHSFCNAVLWQYHGE